MDRKSVVPASVVVLELERVAVVVRERRTSDDVLAKRLGPLEEYVRDEVTARGLSEDGLVGGVDAIALVDEWLDLVGDELQQHRCSSEPERLAAARRDRL